MTYLAIKLGAWALSGLACLTLLWDAHKAPDSLPKTTGQQTITLTSIVPTTTAAPATTTTVPKGCAEYVADASTAGWPADQAPIMARVMFRESRCIPTAYNAKDSNGGSRGLMQINGVHWLPEHSQYDGLICKQMGICTQPPLLDAFTNLRAALLIYSRVGWSAWDICNRTKTCK